MRYSNGLTKEANFILADEVFNEVRNTLNSFFERSLVDDSILYPVARKCMARIKTRVATSTSTIVHVEDYKACLPNDFHRLIYAVGCFQQYCVETDTEPVQLYEEVETEHNILGAGPHCLNDCCEYFNIIQKFPTYSVSYQEYLPLTISSKSRPYCTEDCFKQLKKGVHEIEICDGALITNFETGSVYLEYVQTMEKDGDLLIPDFEPIKEWVRIACMFECLRKVYYNGDDTIRNKMQDMRLDLQVAEANAMSFVKRSNFKEMYDMRKLFAGRYNKFSKVIYGY